MKFSSTVGLKLVKWTLPVVFLLVCVVGALFWQARVDILDEYLQAGFISSDPELKTFFDEFIADDLTGHGLPKLVFGKSTTPNTISVFVVVKDPKHYFQLLPMNAGYDRERDAIFIEYSLIRLAMINSSCRTCKELLSFVLLHELGHRLSHQNDREQFDFILASRFGNILSGLFGFLRDDFSAEFSTRQVRQEEDDADKYAVDTYCRLRQEKGGIGSVPFRDLPSEGLFSLLTQSGPYSPLNNAFTHPSMLSRIERIYSYLASQSILTQRDQDYFNAEYMKWTMFHLQLQQYLFSVLVLPMGEVPLSVAELRHRIYIVTNSGRLFKTSPIELTPQSYKPLEIMHREAVDANARLPFSPTPEDKLFTNNGKLYLLQKQGNRLFRFEDSQWVEPGIRLQGNVVISGESLFTYKWEQDSDHITVSETNLDRNEHRQIREIYLKGIVESASDSVSVVPRSEGLTVVVYTAKHTVRIISLGSDNEPSVLAQMDQVKETAVDESGQYFGAAIELKPSREDEASEFPGAQEDEIRLFNIAEFRWA